MYNESLFINDSGTDVIYVLRAVEGVGVNEDVQTKFIKIVIFYYY